MKKLYTHQDMFFAMLLGIIIGAVFYIILDIILK